MNLGAGRLWPQRRRLVPPLPGNVNNCLFCDCTLRSVGMAWPEVVEGPASCSGGTSALQLRVTSASITSSKDHQGQPSCPQQDVASLAASNLERIFFDDSRRSLSLTASSHTDSTSAATTSVETQNQPGPEGLIYISCYGVPLRSYAGPPGGRCKHLLNMSY